jgi:hypothetical protein
VAGLSSVSAGANQIVCSNTTNIPIAATVTGDGNLAWSLSGTGSFSPDDTSLTAFYTPSAADISAGSVNIFATYTNSCATVKDTTQIIFIQPAVVNAGGDQILCETQNAVTLTGSVTGSTTTGLWSSSGVGSYSPGSAFLTTNYTLTAADKLSGSVRFVLTSTNTGVCNAITDTTNVLIIKSPVVSIISVDTACAGVNISLQAVVTGGLGKGKWTTTNGTGSFNPNDSALIATYVPSVADASRPMLSFRFTTLTDGYCAPVVMSENIIIKSLPVVNAGADVTVCANNATVTVKGVIVSGATKGVWTTTGTGYFVLPDTARNNTYIPSSADTAAHFVSLVFTSVDGCSNVFDALNVTITSAPYVNAGETQYVCKGSLGTALNGYVGGTSTTGMWKTLGTGFFSNPFDLKATYYFSKADTAAGIIRLVLSSTNNGTCFPVTDTVIIVLTSIPAVEAGVNQLVCANDTVQLNGLVSGGSGRGRWTTNGSGTFVPADTIANARYIPSAPDTIPPYITLYYSSIDACVVVKDSLQLEVMAAPEVFVGADKFICENIASVLVSATGTAWAFPVVWSTTGDGVFAPGNIYNTGVNDKLSGNVFLIATTTQNGSCNAAHDTLLLTIIKNPIVEAGVNQTVCTGSNAVLNGVITGGSGNGLWTTEGDGVFNPSDTLLNTSYLPGSNDVLNGSVWLKLTTVDDSVCSGSLDSLRVIIQPGTSANAGPNSTVCSNNPLVSISGSVTNATGGRWISLGGGVFTPSDTLLNTDYIPSATELATDSFAIVLETTGTGLCASNTDTMWVQVIQPAMVNAGTDRFICEGTSFATISGFISGITSKGQWHTLGDGSFAVADTFLNNTYILGPNDKINKLVTLVLTSTYNGLCFQVTDTLQIHVTSIPTINAGADITVCSNNADIALSGVITGGSGTGIWSTYNGSGSFVPSPDVLNSTYLPSSADTALHNINLVLTATDACVLVCDTLLVHFTPAPFVNAGSDQFYCASAGTINLSGTIWGATTTGMWTTNGAGSISSPTSLVTTYTVLPVDTTKDSIQFYLTSTNYGTCLPVIDTVNVFFNSIPSANFVTVPNVCRKTLVEFTDSSIIPHGNITSYQWEIEGNISNDTVVMHAFMSEGTFPVKYSIATDIGCSGSINLSSILN